MQGERIRVRGLVQGVGFRPTVWRIAHETGLRGHVVNDGEGVLVHAWGAPAALDDFCTRLNAECPPLGRIDALERMPEHAPSPDPGFEIRCSTATEVHTAIVADAATCPACLAEVLDPADRRHRYPFTNCTHCGPRLSIVRAIPYDRANTSMAPFRQCPRCQAEYDDPADRRFHAQPNGCAACGPRVWLVDAQGVEQTPAASGARDSIELAARLLAQGQIVALKGIGGFHLACDATDAATVDRLRQRKSRHAKPFALMAADLDAVGQYVHLGDAERALLRSPAAPIVLADRRPDAPTADPAATLAPGIAPGQDQLGFMLPYSPLHHLLLADWQAMRPGAPLVMTSGNRSDEPQCIDNDDAAGRLAAIADFRLLHDRDIVNRVDDSVARVDLDRPRLLRRARGYAPAPFPLPSGFADAPPLVALGAELKNTFCLVRDGQALMSQHLGDLEDARTSDAWERTLTLYQRIFDHATRGVAVDLHPDYRSTRFGRAWAAGSGIALIGVQHHHAHIASVLADNGRPRDAGPVLGVALDGLGMGPDGTLWGGEFLRADYVGFTRLAHLQAVPLPGGTRALLEPWRNTWAQLHAWVGRDRPTDYLAERWPGLELGHWLAQRPLATLERMVERGINSPPSSACGRLFDAVAGALDVCRTRIAYEGQAAIELEALARAAGRERGAYPFELQDGVLRTAALWEALLGDLAAGLDRRRIAKRFHNGLAKALGETARTLCSRCGLDTVALSGGVFQNRTLFAAVHADLADAGLQVLSHTRVPCNDGGIALGQAAVAAARALGSSGGLASERSQDDVPLAGRPVTADAPTEAP